MEQESPSKKKKTQTDRSSVSQIQSDSKFK